MGSVARADIGALREMAREYQTVAASIDAAVRNHLGELRFDGGTAGRAHVAHGDRLHRVLTELPWALREWSRAVTEIATALHLSAQRYDEADARTAGQVG